MIRTLGFATAPGWFLVLGIAPDFTTPVMMVVGVWLLAAMTVAVRQALDFDSTLRAALVCALGWGLVLAIALVLGVGFGPTLAAGGRGLADRHDARAGTIAVSLRGGWPARSPDGQSASGQL